MLRLPLISGCLAVSLLGAVAAQEVVFRTGVDLITVDAVVIGEDGRALGDLTADDFVVEVSGKRRTLASLQFIAPVPATRRTLALEANHFTSNEHDESGRFMVIAVDEAHIRRLEGRPALKAASTFLQSLDPLDRVAVVGLSRIGSIEFTRNRAESTRRLESLTGHTDPVFHQFNIGMHEAVEVADGSRTRLSDVVLRECGRALTEYTSLARAVDDAVGRDACPEQVEQEARAMAQHARTQARISLSALLALIETLKGLDGPKTVALLSEGMVVDSRLVDLNQLAAAARDARVAIYALHMETPLFEASQDRVSPSLLQDMQVRGDGLSRLTGATRGAVFRLIGSDPRPFDRISREIGSYYLLGIEPTAADRDGNVHRIDVRLRGRRATVRARSAFRLPPVAPSPRMREEDLVTLLRSARPAVELPVRVATYVYADPGAADLRVVVSTEADVATGPAADALLGYVLVNASNVIVSSGAHRVQGDRRTFTARVPPGTYTLRVGGIDPFGRRGVVQRTFRAMVLPQNGVRVSDLILAPAPASPAGTLEPIVDGLTADRAAAYLELYADATGLASARVHFEIVSAAGAAAVASVDAVVSRHGERWADARAEISLDSLTPGPYVLVARVRSGARELARVNRPFTLR